MEKDATKPAQPDPKTPTPAEEPKTPTPVEEPKSKTLTIFPVYGPMHDPETGIDYTGEGVTVDKIDPWVQSQIEAKKLRVE